MKVAVSSSGKDLESHVDFRFGRCPYFIIADIEDNKIISFKAIENIGMSGGGAGITAAQLVGNEGVKAVITFHMGPRAFDVLSRLGIEVYIGNGLVKDALSKFINKELEKMTAPMPGRRHGWQ